MTDINDGDVEVTNCNSFGSLLNFADKLTPDPRDTRVVVVASTTSDRMGFRFRVLLSLSFLNVMPQYFVSGVLRVRIRNDCATLCFCIANSKQQLMQ